MPAPARGLISPLVYFPGLGEALGNTVDGCQRISPSSSYLYLHKTSFLRFMQTSPFRQHGLHDRPPEGGVHRASPPQHSVRLLLKLFMLTWRGPGYSSRLPSGSAHQQSGPGSPERAPPRGALREGSWLMVYCSKPHMPVSFQLKGEAGREENTPLLPRRGLCLPHAPS